MATMRTRLLWMVVGWVGINVVLAVVDWYFGVTILTRENRKVLRHVHDVVDRAGRVDESKAS